MGRCSRGVWADVQGGGQMKWMCEGGTGAVVILYPFTCLCILIILCLNICLHHDISSCHIISTNSQNLYSTVKPVMRGSMFNKCPYMAGVPWIIDTDIPTGVPSSQV